MQVTSSILPVLLVHVDLARSGSITGSKTSTSTGTGTGIGTSAGTSAYLPKLPTGTVGTAVL